MNPLISAWPKLESSAQRPFSFPAHPFAAARFGLTVLRSASNVARHRFRGERARALFAGLAAHSVLPLERVAQRRFRLSCWESSRMRKAGPLRAEARKTSTNALAAHLKSLGGEIVTGARVDSLERASSGPRDPVRRDAAATSRIAGSRLPAGFRRALERYRYGPGVCKLDWALDAPIPWKAAECARAGTVHLGGTFEEIAASERDCWQGKHSERPFVLLAQPTLFDTTRAPAGKHIAWAYCHVPNGSAVDMTDAIENQIERFAPGFRRLILKRNVRVAASLESYNPNLIGGDIGGGAADLKQFLLRPTRRFYRTAARGIYLCSSSTPPGPRRTRPLRQSGRASGAAGSFLKETSCGLRPSSCGPAGILIALVADLYAGDFAWFEYRNWKPKPNDPLETITFYYATATKSGRSEIFYDQPQTQTCVHSLFPHAGYMPCWRLERSGIERIGLMIPRPG